MNINKELAIQSRIVELSYDLSLTHQDIQGILWVELGAEVEIPYIVGVIDSFLTDMEDQLENWD